jgi:hypothetical protein
MRTTIYPLGVVTKMIIYFLIYLCILYRWGVLEAFPPFDCRFLAVVHSRTWDSRQSRPAKGWFFVGSPLVVLLSPGFLLVRFPHWGAFFIKNPISALGFWGGCLV